MIREFQNFPNPHRTQNDEKLQKDSLRIYVKAKENEFYQRSPNELANKVLINFLHLEK